MELSILLMEQIAKLFIMIFMGYAVVKMGLLKDEDSKVLSTLVLYLIAVSYTHLLLMEVLVEIQDKIKEEIRYEA